MAALAVAVLFDGGSWLSVGWERSGGTGGGSGVVTGD